MEAFSNTLLPSIFALPDLSNFSLSAQENMTSKIIDRSMTIDLENQNLINNGKLNRIEKILRCVGLF